MNNFSYNKVFLEITPLYSKEIKISENETENIYIPKNTYIQLNITRPTNLIFIEQNPEYINVTIDIGNTNNISIINLNSFEGKENNGKMSYHPITKCNTVSKIYNTKN